MPHLHKQFKFAGELVPLLCGGREPAITHKIRHEIAIETHCLQRMDQNLRRACQIAPTGSRRVGRGGNCELINKSHLTSFL